MCTDVKWRLKRSVRVRFVPVAKHCSHRGVSRWFPARPPLPEPCVDEKYPPCMSAHTNIQICGKPTCLPGKTWSPKGLDSLRKHTPFLLQCAQCVACIWNQLVKEEEETSDRREHFPEAYLRSKPWEVEEKNKKMHREPVFAFCLSSRSLQVPAVQSDAPNSSKCVSPAMCVYLQAKSRPVRLFSCPQHSAWRLNTSL